MMFSKSFPATQEGQTRWIEIYLTDEEEQEEERKCREINIKLMKQCMDDAREIILKQGMKHYDTIIARTAVGLFEKRASHEIHFKEARAKQKFDQKYN